MEKDYSKYFAPSLKDARKRLNKDTLSINYELPEHLMGLGNNRRYIIKTYGCQGNLADSEKLSGILEAMGYQAVDNEASADVIVFNTCAIRENAENRVFGELGRIKGLKKHNPDLIMALGGCMPQEEAVAKSLLAKKEIDFVFGTHNIYQLPEIIDRVLKGEKVFEVYSKAGEVIEDIPLKRASNIKAYINIIYGCDKFCTYCIVPFTRGRERSRAKEDILAEVSLLKASGYKEITLLGQNVNAYGKDLKDNYFLSNLLEDIAKMGIERIRFMTSHPWDFTDELIEVIAKYDNIAPAIHLPLQSASDRILKLMGRRYTSSDYETLVAKLRKKVKNLSLSTDIIVAFPGETEEDFQMTLDLCKKLEYDNAFSFIYSARENTAAAKLKEQIDLDVAKKRLARLNEVLNSSFLKRNEALVGKVLPVLIEEESSKKGYYLGYSDNSRLVNVKTTKDNIGKIIPVEITAAKTWSLDGKALK